MLNRQRALKVVLTILVAIGGVLWYCFFYETPLPGSDCVDALRLKSSKNPILSRLKVPMDSINIDGLRSYRELLKDTTQTMDYVFGRLLVCTHDSMDGFFSDYSRGHVLYDGIAWGSVGFYRYRIRNGVLSIMNGSTTIAIAGTKSNPIPPWEVFDKYAMAHLRQMGILNEHCETVDSVITFGDVNGNPASRTFHAR